MTGENDFEPLTAALEQWFGKLFCELPAELRQLAGKHFLIPWDALSPAQRRSTARQSDIQHHPGLARELTALWEKSLQVADCERTGSNIPIRNWTPTDVELQEKRLLRLRKEEAALEVALKQKAQSLALGWPYDGVDVCADTTMPTPARDRVKQKCIKALLDLRKNGNVDIKNEPREHLKRKVEEQVGIKISPRTFHRALAAAVKASS